MEQTLHIAPRHRLIVNADDLGIGAERDAGILELFAEGAITSASLLVGGRNAAVAAARAVAAGLPLGLHLNLSEGRPASAASLAGADGLLRGKFGSRRALAAGEIAAADLAREIRAQFEAFIALTGELPSHVDGHHHLHVEAAVAAVLAPIMAREYGVYCLRLPQQRGLAATAAGADFERDFHLAVAGASAAAAPVFAAHGIYAPDAFLGQSCMGYRLQAASVAAALGTLAAEAAAAGQALSVELMVHPGHPATDAAAGEFCRSPARAHEMAVLRSAEWRAAIAGWQGISFHALPRPAAGTDGRATILLYGKLTPATGNAETARRYAAAWSTRTAVRFRPALADPASPAALAREAARLQELARREGLDLACGIHLYRAGAPLAAAFAGAGGPPLPYGLLASGTDVNADIDDGARATAMAAALRGADFLLCLNEAQRRRLQALAPLPEETHDLGHGIDIATASRYSLRRTLGLAADARLILFPASLRRLKGILPAVEALAATLAERFPTHVLAVLGPPLEADYAHEVRERVARLQAGVPSLQQRIHLLDGLPHADYLAALREADLVLNASAHEGLSHGLAEAMAAGVPVLARDIPGNRLLVRDGENGRLFADFAALPTAYAACFDEAAASARMAARAAAEIAAAYPAAAEEKTLQALLDRCLARRQTPLTLASGQILRLDRDRATHPAAAENIALFRHLALSAEAAGHLPPTLGLAVDVGCGSGVFAFLLLDMLARHGRRLRQLRFSDPHRASLAALARTLTRHAAQLPMLDSATLDDGRLLDRLLQRGERAELICANLPQTPAPTACRLDRHGGDDGASLICALLAQLPMALAAHGEAYLLHIGLAHPARVAQTLAGNGLQASVLAEQQRRVALREYEDLQPGLADYLLTERAAGRAEFSVHGADIVHTARLLRVRRTGDMR